jgi:hypothetical protein
MLAGIQHRRIQSVWQRTDGRKGVVLGTPRADANFHFVIATLRKKGWRDWHILHSVFTCALNHYANSHVGPRESKEEFKRMSDQFTKLPESGRHPHPPVEVFTEEAMEEFREANLPAILKTWDLEIHHPTISTEAIERFLATRYGYWSDDVEHPDIF